MPPIRHHPVAVLEDAGVVEQDTEMGGRNALRQGHPYRRLPTPPSLKLRWSARRVVRRNDGVETLRVGHHSAMHRVDQAINFAPGEGAWWVASSSAATNVLSTIAAAMLTFVGVVFSVTLVALQLASSQVSPRVLRSFVRSPIPKLAFGTFISTFVYSLFLLSQISGSNARLPVAGVAVALLLVLACARHRRPHVGSGGARPYGRQPAVRR